MMMIAKTQYLFAVFYFLTLFPELGKEIENERGRNIGETL